MRQIMDEQEWWASDDPTSLLQWLQDSKQLNDRKSRLFGVACCRRVWHLLRDERSRRAVEVAEQAADGQCGQEEIMAAWGPAWNAANEAHERAMEAEMEAETNSEDASWDVESAAVAAGNALAGAVLATADSVLAAVCNAADSALGAVRNATGAVNEDLRAAEQGHQAAAVRDLVGPLPFRSVRIDPAWRTPVVLALATSIYDERRFEDLPVLADALEESGCSDIEILAHCRSQQQPHARGCWCLDLLLGRE
jgi:hypothetical protein